MFVVVVALLAPLLLLGVVAGAGDWLPVAAALMLIRSMFLYALTTFPLLVLTVTLVFVTFTMVPFLPPSRPGFTIFTWFPTVNCLLVILTLAVCPICADLNLSMMLLSSWLYLACLLFSS